MSCLNEGAVTVFGCSTLLDVMAGIPTEAPGRTRRARVLMMLSGYPK